MAFDAQGQPIIEVMKGAVDPARADAQHRIDGISGATLTTRGVDNLVKFWLGENGFGPFLARIRKEKPPGSGKAAAAPRGGEKASGGPAPSQET